MTSGILSTALHTSIFLNLLVGEVRDWQVGEISWCCLSHINWCITELAVFPECFSLTCKKNPALYLFWTFPLCVVNVGGATDLTQHPIDAVWLQKRGLVGEFSIERNPLSFEHSKGRVWQEIGRFGFQNNRSPKGGASIFLYAVSFLFFSTTIMYNRNKCFTKKKFFSHISYNANWNFGTRADKLATVTMCMLYRF